MLGNVGEICVLDFNYGFLLHDTCDAMAWNLFFIYLITILNTFQAFFSFQIAWKWRRKWQMKASKSIFLLSAERARHRRMVFSGWKISRMWRYERGKLYLHQSILALLHLSSISLFKHIFCLICIVLLIWIFNRHFNRKMRYNVLGLRKSRPSKKGL